MSPAPSAASPARPGQSVAGTVLGSVTLVLGGAYAALGGQLIWTGASGVARVGGDPVATLFGLGPALLLGIGVAFLPLGRLGLLAGSGVLGRQPWGRLLTFLVAGGDQDVTDVAPGDQDVTDVAPGAAQVLYGVLAFVILIGKRAEFSRPER